MPVQIALSSDFQPWADDKVGDVLGDLEVQRVTGSLGDSLGAPEPHPEPVVAVDSTSEPSVSAEIGIVPEASELTEEAPVSVMYANFAETLVVEVASEDKALIEPVEEDPAVESVVAVQIEAPAVVEEGTTVPEEASPETTIIYDESFASEQEEVSPEVAIPFDETTGSEAAEAPVVKEEAAVQFETPAEVTAVVEASIDIATQMIFSGSPHESSDPGETAVTAPSGFAAQGTDSETATQAAIPGKSSMGISLDHISLFQISCLELTC